MATVNSLICFGGLNGKTVTFTDAGDVVNLSNHGCRPGAAVFFQNTGGALPTGLSANTLYYAKQGANQNKFLLYPTKADAIAGTNQITFTGTGSGTTVVKSALVFTGSDLSRYGNSRVYDGMTSWNTGRAGASPYDIEVAEVGEAYTDIVSAGLVISVPSAQNIITTMVNGIRSAGFHRGNYPSTSLANQTLDMGYIFLNTGPVSGGGAMLKLNRYRDTVDGCGIMNTSASGISYGIDLNVQCRSLHNIIVSSALVQAGIYMRAALSEASGNLVCGWTAGATFQSAQVGLLFTNNILTKNTNGFSAVDGTKGFFYNNISIGNTTSQWPTQPSQLEGASNNAGPAGLAWMTSGGSRVTIATSDFADYANNNFKPANASSPQVETGVSFYGYITEDLAGRFMPDYMNGGAASIDIGCFEFDHGYGPWPATTTATFSGVIAGSEIRVYDVSLNELAGIESCATDQALTWAIPANPLVQIKIINPAYKIKDFPYTSTAGNQTIPIQMEVDRWFSNP